MKAGMILAAMAVALAPMAQAQQSGCPLIESIVAAAPGAFAELRGEEIDEDWYDSKLWLMDADECGVDLSNGSEFYCVWDFSNPAAANTKVVALSEAAKLCLAAWSAEDIAGRKSSNNLTITKGIGMIGSGRNEDTLVQVYGETFEGSQESTAWIKVTQP